MNKREASEIRASQPARIPVLEMQKKLQLALEGLKQTLNLGYELRVKWIPNGEGKVSGEVKGNCIYVYEDATGEALSTLRHEFLDYAISNVVEPYRHVANKLIALLNEEAYRRKERLVGKLSALLPESQPEQLSDYDH